MVLEALTSLPPQTTEIYVAQHHEEVGWRLASLKHHPHINWRPAPHVEGSESSPTDEVLDPSMSFWVERPRFQRSRWVAGRPRLHAHRSASREWVEEPAAPPRDVRWVTHPEDIARANPALLKLARTFASEVESEEDIRQLDVRLRDSIDDDEIPRLVLDVWIDLGANATFGLVDNLSDRLETAEERLGLPAESSVIIAHWSASVG